MSTIFTKIKLDLEEQRFHHWSNASRDLGVSGINESLHVPSIPINIISLCGNSIKNMRSKPCHSQTTSFDFEDSIEDSHRNGLRNKIQKSLIPKLKCFIVPFSYFSFVGRQRRVQT
jgi:hypothetical protein